MPSCVSEPIGLREAALDGFDAGDERRGDRAHAGNQNAQLARRRAQFGRCLVGQSAPWQIVGARLCKWTLGANVYDILTLMRDRATATITTVVVDDEQLACDELAYLLKDFPEIEVIATGSNGLEAVELIQKTGARSGVSGRPDARSGRHGRRPQAAREGHRRCRTSSSSPPTTSTPSRPFGWRPWTTC